MKIASKAWFQRKLFFILEAFLYFGTFFMGSIWILHCPGLKVSQPCTSSNDMRNEGPMTAVGYEWCPTFSWWIVYGDYPGPNEPTSSFDI